MKHRTRRWIVAAGGTYSKGVSKVRSIGGKLAGEAIGGDPISARHYRENGENVVRYLLKAAGPEKAKELGLVRFSETGPIIGKRWGSTVNIGPAARKRWQVAKTE